MILAADWFSSEATTRVWLLILEFKDLKFRDLHQTKGHPQNCSEVKIRPKMASYHSLHLG